MNVFSKELKLKNKVQKYYFKYGESFNKADYKRIKFERFAKELKDYYNSQIEIR